MGQLGQNYANQVGNNLQNAGQARAQGIYGSANAWAGGISQAAGAAGQYLGSQNSWSNNINNPNGSNYIPEIPDSGQYAPAEISF